MDVHPGRDTKSEIILTQADRYRLGLTGNRTLSRWWNITFWVHFLLIQNQRQERIIGVFSDGDVSPEQSQTQSEQKKPIFMVLVCSIWLLCCNKDHSFNLNWGTWSLYQGWCPIFIISQALDLKETVRLGWTRHVTVDEEVAEVHFHWAE